MEKSGVAIVGMGTVGTGVARLLIEHGDRTARNAGQILWLAHAVVRDLDRHRDFDLPAGVLTNDLQRVLDDESVSVVAELVGGTTDAREIILKLLDRGKDVVTANKALLAEHGPELFEAARRRGRSIAFEAAVGGGIPIINTMSQCFSANRIKSLCGILNGTSNYIVTRMDEDGAEYQSVVAEAQRRGFAESDPAFDVDGSDAAQKLAILTQLGFGAEVSWREISRRGIDSVSVCDFAFARELGYRIKLIAEAHLGVNGLQLSVAPMLVKTGEPLAEVRENFNAIRLVGDAVGPVFLQGMGAGQMPTASAVVADLIDTALGRTGITFRTLALWSDRRLPVSIDPPGNLAGRFFLRFNVDDQPGVLAQIAGILGSCNISIASVFQHDSVDADDSGVPVVIMTHRALERSTQSAVDQIAKLPEVRDNHERLRILDQDCNT